MDNITEAQSRRFSEQKHKFIDLQRQNIKLKMETQSLKSEISKRDILLEK